MQIFKPIPLVKNLPVTIECLSAHNDCIIITTKQGHLMKYRFSPKRNTQLTSKEPELDVELIDSQKPFPKKPVTQIETLPEYRIIVALSDGLIHIINFDDLSLIHQIIQKTKGATCFATNLQRIKTECGDVQTMLRMCVVVRRKVMFLYWKNKNFHELPEEINLNDQPRAIAWTGQSTFVGYKSEYDLIKSTPKTPLGEIKNLSATGGRQPEPIIKLLHNDKISINRDENTYILDQDGEPYLKYSITWSDIPINLTEDYPYLIALLPSSIVEVRTIEPHLFIQRLEFAQLTSNYGKIRILTKCAGRTGLVIAASSADIFALVAIPVDQQKAQMVSEKHFELALRLANMEQREASVQDSSTRDIELQYAHDLFRKGSYSESLELFFKLNISPLIVIDLFPDLSDKVFTQMPSSTSNNSSQSGGATLSSATSSPSPSSSSSVSMLSAGSSKTTVQNNQQQLANGSSATMVDSRSDERLTALIRYLIQIRREISGSSPLVRDMSSGSSNARSLTSDLNTQDPDEYTLKSHFKSFRALERLRQEVDTTLLKCYLMTTSALVESLLRLPDNHCKLQLTEKALIKYHKYNELSILYETRGLHRRALDVFRTHFQDSPVIGYEKTVKYLQKLGEHQFEIICEYARWVLQNDPELGLKIFTADLPETEQLKRDQVLEFLRHNAPIMEIPYLEHIIHIWNDKTSLFHTTLLLRYRQKVAPLLGAYLESIGGQVPCPAGQEPGELGELRRKLLDFLEISDHYTTQGLPALLMNEGLDEEHAIVVGKLGQHGEALDIFIYVLNNPKRAEEYCLSVYKKKLPNSKDIFLLLLEKYLNGPSSFSSQQLQRKLSISSAHNLSAISQQQHQHHHLHSHGPASNQTPANNSISSTISMNMSVNNFSSKIVKLLKEHGDKIDPLKAIELLPNEFDLVSLKDYLNATFKCKLHESHEKAMFRQLVMAKSYKVQKSWIQLQQNTKIVIDERTICLVCSKKIGRSAFVCFPNLDLVHYSCKDRYARVVNSTIV